MPVVKSSEFSIAPKGVYLLQLLQIDEKASTLKKDNGGDPGYFWIWKFAGYLQKDKAKTRVDIDITTGTSVSAKDSALKNILTQVPVDASGDTLTLDQMKTYNTDDLIGSDYVVKIGVELKPDGVSQKNTIISIEPAPEDTDVFADI